MRQPWCRRPGFGAGCLLFPLFAALAPAQPEIKDQRDYVRAHYTKYEHRIPMRDGKRLFTAVYSPKDDSRTYPILLMRTPYGAGPYGPDNFRATLDKSDKFLKEGFHFVYQDVRGRYMSEGDYVNVRPLIPNKTGPQDIDESSDAWDTIEWLVRNVRNHNGRVGVWGISYPGFYAAMTAVDAHPALKAASPQAPVTDWFVGDDFHHNGAFYLPHFFRFYTGFGLARPEPVKKHPESILPEFVNAYEFFLNAGPLENLNEKYFKNRVAYWNEFIQHPNYDDYWKARDLRRGAERMKPAMMTVGGWFDAEDLFGALRLYEAIEKAGKAEQNILVMGPWSHGQWGKGKGEALGHVRFHADTGEYYRDEIEFPFFLRHLKERTDVRLAKAYMFETGSNQWRKFDAWPPPKAEGKTLYFHSQGNLTYDPPRTPSNSFDEYVSDPDKPVPFTPYIAKEMTTEHMLDDQRFAAMRPDVLAYQTEALEEDLVLAGPILASLHVSTTGTDSDFVVKVIDVYPDDYPNPDPNPQKVVMGGYQQLVRGEIFRGRFRRSFERPEPFVANRIEKVEFELPDVYHNFRRGHRVMVQVQSTWFPLADRNPQKFVPNIYQARREDFQKATQRVFRSATHPSSLRVSVLR